MAQHGTTATTDPVEAIAAAIGRLGQATPGEIAADAGVAYSTTNKKLRDLAAAGRAEKFTADDNRTLWRLTDPAASGVKGSDPAAAVPSGTDRAPAVPDEPDPADADTGNPDTSSLDTGSVDAAAAEVGDGGQPPETGPHDQPTPDAATRTDAPVPAGAAGGADEPTTDTAGEAGQEPADTGQPATQASSDPAHEDDPRADAPATPPQPEPAGPAKARRASGTLDGAVLDILEPHPDRGFKVSELCKLIDKANEGSDAAKASPGAVVLAAQRLARKGKAVLVVEKPATFQLAPAGD